MTARKASRPATTAPATTLDAETAAGVEVERPAPSPWRDRAKRGYRRLQQLFYAGERNTRTRLKPPRHITGRRG